VSESQQPVVTFLSDYGLQDEFVGVCHAVIARRCPQARVIDLAHAIPRHDVRSGALTLASALPYLPVGVHLAVVDPEVGTTGRHARRAVAVRCASDDQLLVGPDNGLLAPALEHLGGALEAVEIGRSPERLQPVSATFHGRDIFAPVAAALAAGTPLAETGEPLAVESLHALQLPASWVDEEGLHVHALHFDHFGNVTLDADHERLAQAGLRLGTEVCVELAGGSVEPSGGSGGRHRGRYALTFADVAPGELLLYEDARGMAALAINRGSAHDTLRIARDAELLVRPA
jgi:S-adenosylmethionine hydrolase